MENFSMPLFNSTCWLALLLLVVVVVQVSKSVSQFDKLVTIQYCAGSADGWISVIVFCCSFSFSLKSCLMCVYIIC